MDFSLSDVAWVGGGLLVFTLLRVAWAYRAELTQAIMSRRAPAPDSRESVVLRPVDATSMEAHTAPTPASGMTAGVPPISPDIDAADSGMEWEMPRLSRYLTDDEFIVFLATQKLRDGKYRMSANQIVTATRGDRNHVLSVVRQVRESAAAQYPQRTPEQQAAREALGLPSN